MERVKNAEYKTKQKDKTVFAQKWRRKEPVWKGNNIKRVFCVVVFSFFVKSQTAQLAAGNCEQCVGSKCSSCMSVEYIPLQRHPSQRTNSGATTGTIPTRKHR